ncbi:uncharacterized protein TRIVIDRAFT_63977 [Trichoderma virens Gv29-8]|uniref:Uncharacterized protein n=1 Tax=Hypocrea virens (strain Gv29-8 / FGSC 10586) TaxID=413071 RepID=G9MNZ1_HYPVG|nr:uncharacterized protein TRIVIDRAFT_63977 [Trichoderma virens Gv29-8]EHK23593.1 hypothetical protein TRIVIDRAFT_63977 [Trichoderma virens Gv29-8]UKZ49892.1 hypothetical protein TrVGV298_004145 [Trichoderma virens]
MSGGAGSNRKQVDSLGPELILGVEVPENYQAVFSSSDSAYLPGRSTEKPKPKHPALCNPSHDIDSKLLIKIRGTRPVMPVLESGNRRMWHAKPTVLLMPVHGSIFVAALLRIGVCTVRAAAGTSSAARASTCPRFVHGRQQGTRARALLDEDIFLSYMLVALHVPVHIQSLTPETPRRLGDISRQKSQALMRAGPPRCTSIINPTLRKHEPPLADQNWLLRPGAFLTGSAPSELRNPHFHLQAPLSALTFCADPTEGNAKRLLIFGLFVLPTSTLAIRNFHALLISKSPLTARSTTAMPN